MRDIIFIAAIIIIAFLGCTNIEKKDITNFEECAAAGKEQD